MNQNLVSISAPVYDKADIVVIGGGPSGVAAAISASRCGKKVILIEQTGQLGGMGTLGNVSVFMRVGNFTGIYDEILSELAPMSMQEPEELKSHLVFNPFLIRYYLNQKLEKEKVRVLYHTVFITTIVEQNKIKGIIVKTREGVKTIEGEIFIDCTGDGSVAIEAGVNYNTGRSEDGLTQPMTLMFQMQDTGKPVNRNLPEGCYHYETKEDLPQGRHLFFKNTRDGTLLVNMTRVKGNGAKIEDINLAEKEALKQVFSVADYLQRNGFANYIISHIATQTGVRETNQITGLYTLTEDDLFKARKFHDVVAQTNYDIDIHSPDGGGTCDIRRLDSYDIPYRCLVPQGIESLLVAGRAISATHIAMSSFRVQPTCFALGQAAGIAGSIALDKCCSMSEIPIATLHEILKEQNVVFD